MGSVPCVVAQHLGPNGGRPLAWRSFASLMVFVLPVSMPWRGHLGAWGPLISTRNSVPEIALDHDRVVVPVRGTPPAESSWRGNAPGRGRSFYGTNARGKGASGATVSRRLQRRLKPSNARRDVHPTDLLLPTPGAKGRPRAPRQKEAAGRLEPNWPRSLCLSLRLSLGLPRSRPRGLLTLGHWRDVKAKERKETPQAKATLNSVTEVPPPYLQHRFQEYRKFKVPQPGTFVSVERKGYRLSSQASGPPPHPPCSRMRSFGASRQTRSCGVQP